MADSLQYKSLPEVLYCKTCNYYTCNKKQIEKHFLSSKHIKNISISVEIPAPPLPPAPPAEEPIAIEDIMQSDSDIPLPPPNTPTPLVCECCGKIYKRKRALLRHQQSKQQEQQKEQDQLDTKDTNSSLDDQENDNQSLELISDGGGEESSSNKEFEYITIEPLILDPLIINNDVMYFMQVFIYSIDVVMGISVFINKVFSFFSLKSYDDIN
jgi:hypothetical protein